MNENENNKLRKAIEKKNQSIATKNQHGIIKYKIIKDYSNTYIADEMKKEEQMQYEYFRVFNAAKSERKRMLNIDPTFSYDFYNDSLMDYASIISYKLQKPWFLYNRLISVQIPECLNHCWHCYLPHELFVHQPENKKRYKDITAQELIDAFIDQQEFDLRLKKYSNVLRITGGEPFLVPQLILDCLNILRDKKLADKVFLWTETNLLPFIGETSFMDSENNKDILTQIAQFNNFLVHPCFHGLNLYEFISITKNKEHITVENQINALKKLHVAGIDLYPTFGSNVCNPSNLKALFEQLMGIEDSFPLKTALIEYNLDAYPPIKKRLQNQNESEDSQSVSKRQPKLYPKFASLRIWNELLLKHYGVGYGIIPRHLAANIKKYTPCNAPQKEYPTNDYNSDNIIYLFKTTYRSEYRQFLINAIAYPEGHICSTSFDKKWAQNDFTFHINLLKDQYKEKRGLLIYADKDQKELIPIREFKMIVAKEEGNLIHITIKLGGYVSIEGNSKKNLKMFNNILKIYFGKITLPPGGKYFLIGEYLFDDKGNHKMKHPKINYDDRILKKSADFQDIVNSLTIYKTMKDVVFYKIELINLKQECKEGTIYTIKKGGIFKIKISIYLSAPLSTDSNGSKFIIKSTNEKVKLQNAPEISFGRYNENTWIFKVDEDIQEETGRILIGCNNPSVFAPEINLNLHFPF